MCTTAHGRYIITSLLRPPYGIVDKLTGPVITFTRVRHTTHVLVCVRVFVIYTALARRAAALVDVTKLERSLTGETSGGGQENLI